LDREYPDSLGICANLVLHPFWVHVETVIQVWNLICYCCVASYVFISAKDV